MAERQPIPAPGLLARCDQPLISIILEEDGHEVVRYFTDEAEADAAIPDSATQEALNVAGAWSDLDWEDMESGLDRIRHESSPSPPISL